MKNIIVFAGSNSKYSINKQLVVLALNRIENVNTEVLDLNDYELPLYGLDLENDSGIPENAITFYNKLKNSDGIILSLAEHNGAYASVFKNLFDWLSRIESGFFNEKPLLLMATSPGARGGQSVLEIAKDRFPRHKANIIATFSLPSFNDNFSNDGITNTTLNSEFNNAIKQFKNSL